MFDHISIGVRDVAKAKAFYDAALKPLGLTCLSADESSLGYGKEAARFWVNAAEHPVPDDPKSGLHFCFTAPSRQSAWRRLRFRRVGPIDCVMSDLPAGLAYPSALKIRTGCVPAYRAPPQ